MICQRFSQLVVSGILFLLAAVPSSALDPTQSITQYHQDVWTEREGLPQGSVAAILQDRQGYLWLGTRDGLARFDGSTFTVFTAEDHPGLGGNDVRALFEDRSGRLWIGTFNAGVSCYANGRFESFQQTNSFPGSGVLHISEDDDGVLWFGTWDGLVRLQDGKFITCGTAEGISGHSVWSVLPGPNDRLWIGGNHALYNLEKGRYERYPLPGSAQGVRELFLDSAGTVWAGGSDGLIEITSAGNRLYGKTSGLPDSRIHALLEDREGSLWIGTWGGLARWRQGQFETYTQRDGLPSNFIECLFEGTEGSLWIGTRGGGLVRLRETKFLMVGARQGLPDELSKTVLQTRDGQIWIGTDGGGLSVYSKNQPVTYSIADGLPSSHIWSLAEDEAGRLWVGTGRPAGLAVFDGRRFRNATNLPPLTSGIRALLSEPGGTLWIGTDGQGLFRQQRDAWELYTENALPSPLIRMLARDRAGHLWIATNRGLCRKTPSAFDVFTASNGLAHEAVYTMLEDPSGVLWFGTQRGLSSYQSGRFQSYRTKTGLHQTAIFQVLEDKDFQLWLSSNRGIFALKKSDLERFHAGELLELPSSNYGIADGMKTAQCSGGSQPAGCRDAEGKLWIASAKGVVVVHPERVQRKQQPPPLVIEKVFASQREVNLRAPVELEADTAELVIHYTALSFVAPEKVRFKYRLDGVDKNWIDAGSRRVAYYRNLPPGRYRFRVIAGHHDGVWNEAGAAFAFALAPHFYQTFWFFAAVALCGAIGVWQLHRWRMLQAQARFRLILAERGRIARDLHDTLAQGFAGIAFQLEAVAVKVTDAPADAQRHLSVALNMVRHSLQEAKRSVLNLRAPELEHATLADALRASTERMLGDQNVAWALLVSGQATPLSSTLENHLLRIGQEAVTNAIRHAHPSSLQISLEYQPRHVTLRVKDNGAGSSADLHHSVKDGHLGLLGMQERARQIGGRFAIHSRSGHGTEIVVTAPLRWLETSKALWPIRKKSEF